MAIPLPALQVQTPQIDPARSMAEALQVKGMMQQQAMQQRAMQDQQTTMQVLSQTGGDMDKALPILAGKISPQTFIGLQKNHIETKKAIADLTEKQLLIKKDQNDRLSALVQQASQLPDDQYAQAWPTIVQSAKQTSPDSQVIQQLDPTKPVPKAALPQLSLGLMTTDQYIKGQQEQRAAKKAPFEQQTAEATAKKVGAEAEKTQAEADAIKNYQAQGIVPGIPLENQEAAAWLIKNPGKTLADYQKYKATLVPAFNFNLQAAGATSNTPTDASGQPISGPALYKTFGGKAGIVQAIVEGRQSPPASFALKSPYWQDVMKKVYQVDPQFNEQRAQIRKAFSVGKDAQNIRSLNTATVHLDTFSEAAKALQNGQFTPGNALYNKVSQVLGGPAPTTFEGLRSAVAGEMANALKGNATDPEIASIKNTIMSKNSPAQLSQWVDSNLHILGQKLNTYKEAYEQQNPGDTVYSPVLPSAAAVFQKHSISAQPQGGGQSFSVTAPNGRTYTFKDQASLDAFKAKAGIK